MIAPDVFRQRLLIEGYFDREVDETVIHDFFTSITNKLSLRVYGDPIIFSPDSGMGKEENAGYDAFIPLIDSGISLYVWSKQKFVSCIIYTCKGFDAPLAETSFKDFFKIETFESQSF